MFHIRLVISLVLTVAFLPRTLASQYSSSDSGQYVILSAQYGTARRHVDVSNRLKELARQDRIFRMGNSTFGVDPDPGQVKALRIYARGPDGRERMFEYREGSTVDGSQFSSWGSGDWGNEPWSGRWKTAVFVICSCVFALRQDAFNLGEKGHSSFTEMVFCRFSHFGLTARQEPE